MKGQPHCDECLGSGYEAKGLSTVPCEQDAGPASTQTGFASQYVYAHAIDLPSSVEPQSTAADYALDPWAAKWVKIRGRSVFLTFQAAKFVRDHFAPDARVAPARHVLEPGGAYCISKGSGASLTYLRMERKNRP